MTKTHKIQTITDIYNVVNKDNMKGFLEDFSAWLEAAVTTKKAIEGMEGVELKELGFVWNDDGEWGVLKDVKVSITQDEKAT